MLLTKMLPGVLCSSVPVSPDVNDGSIPGDVSSLTYSSYEVVFLLDLTLVLPVVVYSLPAYPEVLFEVLMRRMLPGNV